jgi:hypothetical protein
MTFSYTWIFRRIDLYDVFLVYDFIPTAGYSWKQNKMKQNTTKQKIVLTDSNLERNLHVYVTYLQNQISLKAKSHQITLITLILMQS